MHWVNSAGSEDHANCEYKAQILKVDMDGTILYRIRRSLIADVKAGDELLMNADGCWGTKTKEVLFQPPEKKVIQGLMKGLIQSITWFGATRVQRKLGWPEPHTDDQADSVARELNAVLSGKRKTNLYHMIPLTKNGGVISGSTQPVCVCIGSSEKAIRHPDEKGLFLPPRSLEIPRPGVFAGELMLGLDMAELLKQGCYGFALYNTK